MEPVRFYVDKKLESKTYPIDGEELPIVDSQEVVVRIFSEYFGLDHLPVLTLQNNSLLHEGSSYLLFSFGVDFKTLVERNEINLFEDFSVDAIQALRQRQLKLFAFSLTDCFPEFLCTSKDNQSLFGYLHEQCQRFDIDPAQIVVCVPDSHIEKNYSVWRAKKSIDKKMTTFSVDYFEADCLRRSDRILGDKLQVESFVKTVEPDHKRFILLCARSERFRLILFHFLLSNNYLEEHFHYSYLNRFNDKYSDDVFKSYQEYCCNLNIGKMDFGETIKFHNESPHFLDGVEADQVDLRMPHDYIQKSSINVVLETCFTSNESVFLTEKTFKPIICKQPFILFAMPMALEWLRSLGYSTFPEIFDESYDQEICPDLRMQKLLKNIGNLCEMSHLEFNDLIRQPSVQKKIEGNYKLFLHRNKHRKMFENLYCHFAARPRSEFNIEKLVCTDYKDRFIQRINFPCNS